MDVYDYYITDEDYRRAEQNGIRKETLASRILTLGWDKETAITKPPRKIKDYGGYTKIAKENGISNQAFLDRLKRGWSKEKAATTPIMDENQCIKAMADKISKYPKEIIELAEKNGICYRTFISRVHKGMSYKEAATKPVMTRKEIGLMAKSKNQKFIYGKNLKGGMTNE